MLTFNTQQSRKQQQHQCNNSWWLWCMSIEVLNKYFSLICVTSVTYICRSKQIKLYHSWGLYSFEIKWSKSVELYFVIFDILLLMKALTLKRASYTIEFHLQNWSDERERERKSVSFTLSTYRNRNDLIRFHTKTLVKATETKAMFMKEAVCSQYTNTH